MSKISIQKPHHQKIGIKGENIAAAFLEKEGFQVLARNYRRREGEIDLIVTKNKVIHFVEVKTRTTGFGGAPEEFVNWHKQKKIMYTAQIWLDQNQSQLQNYKEFCFSIVAIRFQKNNKTEIKFIKDAFINE